MIRIFLFHLPALMLALILTMTSSGAQNLAPLGDEDRTLLREEIRSYLLENPELLLEVMQLLEDREAAAQAVADKQLVSTLSEEIFQDGQSWEGGNAEGDITLVEFVDYRCGYCRRAHGEVAELIESDGDIRIIVKEFPILGQASLLSSRFAIAVRLEAGNDAYKRAHDALISMRPEPNDASLRNLASTLGLDADAVMTRMDDPQIIAELRANRALAEKLSIQGTPTFIIQDEVLRGYVPLAQMQEIVANQRRQEG